MVVVGEKNYKHIDEGPIRKRQKHNEEGDSDDEGGISKFFKNYSKMYTHRFRNEGWSRIPSYYSRLCSRFSIDLCLITVI